MRHEKVPGISPEELERRANIIESKKAVENLEKAFDEASDSSCEEVEEELLSVPGVKKEKGLDEMKEHLRKKERRKEI